MRLPKNRNQLYLDPRFIEESDPFLDLFPHRYGYIWADQHQAGMKPAWNTEHKHPLSDRLILQGGKLYGVRFGKITHYLMLDIDRASPYHPANDEFAIATILQALEPLDLAHYVPVSSSYSGGIHLYFPFYQGQKSWMIARAAAALLEANNLKLKPGELELFPHPRRYSAERAEYNAHRLPLQVGSYLLNSEWETTFSTQAEFINRWREAENKNAVDELKLERALKQFERRGWGFIKGDARKLLNDLNAEIERGWTGYGQTNYLIGRIALKVYIFHHVTHPSGEMLSGMDLAYEIADIAEHLPGFNRWCRHKQDIIKQSFYWARSVEASPKYYRYGGAKLAKRSAQGEITWNQRQAYQARQRIQQAINSLIEGEQYPDTVRGRLMAIKAHGISADTLYRHRDLWHPSELAKPATEAVIQPIQAIEGEARSLEPATEAVIHPIALISFIGRSECPPQGGNFDELLDLDGGCGGLSTGPTAQEAIALIKSRLAAIQRPCFSELPPDSPPPDQDWFANQSHYQGGKNEPSS